MWMVVLGCNHFHKTGVVHRDMKPANILVDSNTKTLKIIDFGLAKSEKSAPQEEGLIIGSPIYISPEIFKHDGHPDSY